MSDEAVIIGRLGDVPEWNIPEDYFSMAIVKRSEFPINREKEDLL
jgi:hypothetical protein